MYYTATACNGMYIDRDIETRGIVFINDRSLQLFSTSAQSVFYIYPSVTTPEHRISSSTCTQWLLLPFIDFPYLYDCTICTQCKVPVIAMLRQFRHYAFNFAKLTLVGKLKEQYKIFLKMTISSCYSKTFL